MNDPRPTIPMSTPVRPSWLYQASDVDAERTGLGPIGPTDVYSFRNGVIAYFSPGFVHIHASVNDQAITIPRVAYAVTKAAGMACGLTDTEAALLVEASERFAR